jgi:cytochrome c biogenesis protein ResB
MVLPVDVRHAIRQVQEDERSTFDLPFDVTVTKFAVDYYDPDYQVFRPTGAAVTNAADGYAHVTRLSPGKRPTLAVPEYGALPVAELRYAGTEGLESWRRQVALTNGWVLQRARPTARHFEADLRFSDAAAGGNRSLRVNHPVNYGGWRFYLMSHGEEGPPYVVLLARRDPGRPLAVAGIWMLIFGTAMLGFARRRETGPAVPERESGHAA